MIIKHVLLAEAQHRSMVHLDGLLKCDVHRIFPSEFLQTHQKLLRQEAEPEQAGAGEDVCPQVVTIGDTSRARCLLIIINI